METEDTNPAVTGTKALLEFPKLTSPPPPPPPPTKRTDHCVFPYIFLFHSNDRQLWFINFFSYLNFFIKTNTMQRKHFRENTNTLYAKSTREDDR